MEILAIPQATAEGNKEGEMKPEEAVFEELLAALQSLLSWVDGLPVKHPQQAKDRQRARAAIAKATGSTKAARVE